MTKLETMIDQAGKIVILGHVNPDGDCAGSCLAVYNYIKEWDSTKAVTVRLERAPSKFSYLSGFDAIETEAGEEAYDLCICLDSSDEERLGDFKSCFDRSAKTICIDHHITNRGYAQENVIDGHASSACEVVYGQLDESRISKHVAECIYTGIIHDTGVFKYSNTSRKTMEIAGKMMEKALILEPSSTAVFIRRHTCSPRSWEERCWRALHFWMADVFSVWSGRKIWISMASIRVIWTAS